MGSKVIILLGVLVSALFLYFSVNKLAPAPHMQNATVGAKTVKQVVVPVEPIPEPATAIPNEEPEAVKKAVERISTPAFGFMSGAKKNQIVALMSDNDKNGILAASIEELCKKEKCSKDMRYENDIIDAPWQEGVIKVIKLLTDKSIEGGSLFIEGNVLKLEGTISSQKTKDTLSDILNSVKSDTFKIENYTKVSPTASEKQDTKTAVVDVPKKEAIVEKVDKKEQEVQTVEPTIKKIKSKPIVKPIVEKAEAKPVSTTKIEKAEQKPVSVPQVKKAEIKPAPKPKVKKTKYKPVETIKPISKPDIVAEPFMETTLDDEKQISAEHSIYEDIPAKGLVAKPYMKTTSENNVEKSIQKVKKVSKTDIVAKPEMSTTLDADSRVRAILKDIKSNSKTVGIVAEPHMETTAE